MAQETTTITMTGAAGGSKPVKIPQVSPAMGWLNIINLTDNLIYITSVEAADHTQPFYTFGPYTTLSVPLTESLLPNFKTWWTNPNGTNPTLIKTAQFIFTSESLGLNQNYSTSFAYANGALGMTISGTPNINANIQNAQLNSHIVDAKIGTNDLILLAHNLFPVSNLAVNATVFDYCTYGTSYMANDNLGVYDGVFICIKSNSNKNYGITGIVVYLSGTNNNLIGFTTLGTSLPTNANYIATMGSDGTYWYGKTNCIFTQALTFNAMAITLQNLSGATIVNDTVEAWFFAIKSGISNPTSVPVNIQAAAGSYDIPNYVDSESMATGSTTILVAGNYITKIALEFQNSDATNKTPYILKNGSNILSSRLLAVGETFSYNEDFKNGIYNAGLSVTNNGLASKLSVWGIISTSALTPSQKVSVIS